MRKIYRKEVIEELKEKFDVSEKRMSNGFVSCNKDSDIVTFFIDKRYMWRMDVIKMLKEYFDDVYIIDGQCRIEPFTLVWTTFKIEPVVEEENKETETQK